MKSCLHSCLLSCPCGAKTAARASDSFVSSSTWVGNSMDDRVNTQALCQPRRRRSGLLQDEAGNHWEQPNICGKDAKDHRKVRASLPQPLAALTQKVNSSTPSSSAGARCAHAAIWSRSDRSASWWRLSHGSLDSETTLRGVTEREHGASLRWTVSDTCAE